MSFHVLSWVADHSPTKGAARLLLVMMADMANDEGEFYCTNATLARRCRFTVRSLQSNLHKLAKDGAIQIISQAATSGRTLNNAYRLNTPGRSIPQLRSKPPRAKKPSPSPLPPAESPRAKKPSPSLPEETFALTPKKPSPSPRRNLRPHIEPVNRNLQEKPLTEQQQQPRAPAGNADEGKTAAPEEVKALRLAITTLAELTENSATWWADWVTSGSERNGRRICRPTLRFDRMTTEHAQNSLLDAQKAIRRVCVKYDITSEALRDAERRAESLDMGVTA